MRTDRTATDTPTIIHIQGKAAELGIEALVKKTEKENIQISQTENIQTLLELKLDVKNKLKSHLVHQR